MPGDVPCRSPAGPQGFDAREVTDTIKRALASAGLDTQRGPMKGVTDTIDQALAAAGLRPAHRRARSARRDHRRRRAHDRRRDVGSAEIVQFPRADVAHRARAGEFASRAFTNHAGTRAYKVYVPRELRGGRERPGAADRDAPRLHADARRLRRRHADERAGRRARLPRRLSRAGAARERHEVLELVSPGRPGPRPRRARDPRGHRARGGARLPHRRAPHLRRRPVRRRCRWPSSSASPIPKCSPPSAPTPACRMAWPTTCRRRSRR